MSPSTSIEAPPDWRGFGHAISVFRRVGQMIKVERLLERRVLAASRHPGDHAPIAIECENLSSLCGGKVLAYVVHVAWSSADVGSLIIAEGPSTSEPRGR